MKDDSNKKAMGDMTGILAYSRTRNFFFAYYVFKTLTAMVCDGSVHCLALAYVVNFSFIRYFFKI